MLRSQQVPFTLLNRVIVPLAKGKIAETITMNAKAILVMSKCCQKQVETSFYGIMDKINLAF